MFKSSISLLGDNIYRVEYKIWNTIYTNIFFFDESLRSRQERGMAATKRYAQQPELYYRKKLNLLTEDNIPGPSRVGIRGDDATNVGPLEKPG